MEKLHGLIYTSRALFPFDLDQLEDLSARAALKNHQLGITGYLYYENKKFLQYLEGSPGHLEALIARIEQDSRHEILTVLKTQRLKRRKFPTWDMKWLTKPLLVSIRMENILAGFMEMIEKDAVDRSPENEERVWEMVDRISSFSTQIV